MNHKHDKKHDKHEHDKHDAVSEAPESATEEEGNAETVAGFAHAKPEDVGHGDKRSRSVVNEDGDTPVGESQADAEDAEADEAAEHRPIGQSAYGPASTERGTQTGAPPDASHAAPGQGAARGHDSRGRGHGH